MNSNLKMNLSNIILLTISLELHKKLNESAKKPNEKEHQTQDSPVIKTSTPGSSYAANVTAGQPTSNKGSDSESSLLNGLVTFFVVLVDFCISVIFGIISVIRQTSANPPECD